MKKVKGFVSLLVILCLIICTAGCADKKTQSQENINNPQEVNEETSGENKTEQEEMEILEKAAEKSGTFFSDIPKELTFADKERNGKTTLTLQDDGSFVGSYEAKGDDKEKTVYRCSFSGKFSTPFPLDAYTYISVIENMRTQGTTGEESIKDGTKYINTPPYGIEKAQEVVFYIPGTPISSMNEKIVSHVKEAYNAKDVLPDGVYVLYSFNDEAAFSGK